MRSLNSLKTGVVTPMRSNAHPMKTTKLIASLLLSVSLLSACASQQNAVSSADHDAVAAMSKAGKAYFDEKCKSVAGEKIYRTVSDVEGVLLLKVRPERSQTQLEDPMWPGAAFNDESYGERYIKDFLGYEHGRLPQEELAPGKYRRGYVTTDIRPGGLPGYRYVDVMDAKDGLRYRYTGRREEPWQYDKTYLKGYIKFFLDRTPTNDLAPRYGVTFEDHVIPEERAIGVASSTVRVIDLSTKEVLGEMIRYAWRPRGIRLTEWLTASNCPHHAVGSNSATRKFVDQVLKPKGK